MSFEYDPERLADESTVPTQLAHPFKAVLRTVVAFLLGLASVWLISNIPGYEAAWVQFGPVIVDIVTNTLFAVIVGFFTWLFTLPKVNAFLTAIGLGARPKAIEDASGEG